jgi:hypothetical protein
MDYFVKWLLRDVKFNEAAKLTLLEDCLDETSKRKFTTEPEKIRGNDFQ